MQEDASQTVTSGAVRMSLDVSVADYTGWEQAPVLTKADFVAVDEAYRYAGENTVDGNKLLV